jgi:WD repeat-containing protein 35
VGEWIPFGANQIVAVNEKLGTADRCQGGLFTGELDSDPTATSFEVPAGLTKVGVLDFNEVKYINIEAEINFPEDEGIVQVEEFGMHFDVNGKVVYGMKIDAIMDKLQDDICIDLLARVLVDVHLDSSRITKDLISKYQMTLLECAFMNDAANRDKFNMLITESIEPKMEAIEYLDGEDIENELKQVLGDTQGAYDLTANDVLITGRNGLLIAGPNAKQHEPALVLYLQLHSRNMFMRVFFTRVFVLGDELRKIRDMIGLAQFAHSNESGGIKVGDPTIVDKVRDRLSVASRDLILMLETMGFMADSLEAGVLQALPRPKDQGGKELHRVLRNDFMIANLKKRVRDLQKNLNGCVKELSNLSAMTEVINTKQLEDVYKGVVRMNPSSQ